MGSSRIKLGSATGIMGPAGSGGGRGARSCSDVLAAGFLRVAVFFRVVVFLATGFLRAAAFLRVPLLVLPLLAGIAITFLFVGVSPIHTIEAG